MRYSGPQKVYKYPDPNIREEDYLAYLIDACELNEWQKNAFPDMLARLRNGQPMLSEKQKQSVASAVHSFGLKDDIKEGFLCFGYSSGTTGGVSTKMQQANDGEKVPYRSFDDMDDDIPF